MGRGYWLPPNEENLVCCDGFYIDSKPVYEKGYEQGWNELIKYISEKIQLRDNTFKKVCEWRECSISESRFVISENYQVQIIADDVGGYIAVYVIIPEDCTKPNVAKQSFPRYLQNIKNILLDKYKGNVYRRINSSHIEPVG